MQHFTHFLALAVAAGSRGLVLGSRLLRTPGQESQKEQEQGQGQGHEQASYRQTLHNYQNVQYYADFKIGGQQIAGIFDTGSFELLVRSSRCGHCVHPTPPYEHEKSTTFESNGTVGKHVFGSGPCVSVLGYESVTVGPNLTSPRQAFWEIMDHRISVLDTAKFAAIVGIGPDFAQGNTEKTLLMSYGVTEFSVCLQKAPGSPGFLNWGPTEGRHRVATASVIGQHHWVTRLHNVTFSSPKNRLAQIPCGGSAGCAAIVDSGTSLIAAPGVALMQLSEMIPQIAEDCSNMNDLPTLRFVIDGHPFELPPQAYVMRVTGASLEADDIWDILFFKPKLRKLDMCMPAFMQIDMMSQHGPVWILGMPFFRYYHTTFDRERKEMRFAEAGPNCTATPYRANRTESLLAVDRSAERQPMDVEVDALVPPTLSGMMDYPFGSAGELDL
uniref:Peptidase A1 domain-containing protein n=1 Tax=Alexandrium catenella TaxID=2925 RepID=A0A7S1R9Z1_ALECA